MLSKSQARWFFLSMTAGFSAVFLWLTVDSLRQVPARSHEDQLTPAVARGKDIWERNNCMGCHTILGEGAYYAPELTQVVARRGSAWIATFLADPAAMFPGQRQMVQYHFTPEQIADLVAFLEWIGKIDTNGFPQPPDLGLVPTAAAATPDPATAAALANAPATFKTVCVACHSVGGQGGNVGPALANLAARYDRAKLDAWLSDPTSVKPGTAMPNLHLPESERAALVDWLLTLP